MQLLRQYARESYGLATQAGWCRDSEAYLLLLRLSVDIQAAAHSGADSPDRLDLLREVLREWVLQTRDVGVTRPQASLPSYIHVQLVQGLTQCKFCSRSQDWHNGAFCLLTKAAQVHLCVG